MKDSTNAVTTPSPRPARRRLRASALYAIPTLVLASAAWWLTDTPLAAASEDASATAAAAPPAPTVTVETVRPQRFIERDERIGRIAATETVELRPEVSGRIVSVGFQAGDLIEAGQILFEIDSRPYEATVAAARAAIARAEARTATAQREAERAEALFAQRAISSEEAEMRRSVAAETSADLLSAQAALETALIDLERTQVKAPISGQVSRAYVTPGNLVSGSPTNATLLTTIVTTGEVHVYVQVDDAVIQRFRQAEKDNVLQRDAFGRVPVSLKLTEAEGFAYHGWVESLDNRIDPNTGSLTVRLYFEDPERRLLPGSFARVRLPLSGEETRLTVNERAIGTDQSQKFVLVVDESNTVAYRPVTLGPQREDSRVITSGLASGERVIVKGLQHVRPGATVETIAASETSRTDVAQR